MFLSRLSLAPNARRSAAFWRSLGIQDEAHRSVWSLFGDHADRRRDFLYRLDFLHGKPMLWTLSDRAPEPDPSLWRMETRQVTPKLRAGDHLEFSVRVNPIVSRQGKRHDVVMDLKRRTNWQEQDHQERASQAELVQEALEGWLAGRANRLGARVHRLRADGYQVSRFRKGSGREVHLGICNLSGTLKLSDPVRFLETWRTGLGPAKGYGCGLLLIRRVA